MVAYKIEDLKGFTQKLFLGEDFDSFLVKEAQIITYNSFTIDGHIRQGYYSDEELERMQVEAFSFWKTLRPVCFSLIKGKRLPEKFVIDLQAEPGRVQEFLTTRGLTHISPDQITGLHLRVQYEEDKLLVITGTSLTFFTMDKTLDHEWDDYVRVLLKSRQIAVTE